MGSRVSKGKATKKTDKQRLDNSFDNGETEERKRDNPYNTVQGRFLGRIDDLLKNLI